MKPVRPGLKSEFEVVIDHKRDRKFVAKGSEFPSEFDKRGRGVPLGSKLENTGPSLQELTGDPQGFLCREISKIADGVEPGLLERFLHPSFFSSRNFATHPMSYFPAMKSG